MTIRITVLKRRSGEQRPDSSTHSPRALDQWVASKLKTPRLSHNLKNFQRAMMLLLLFVGIATTLGCRSLHNNRLTRGLTSARQYSLRGADYLQQRNYREAGPLFSEALKHSDADERAHWGMAEVLWSRDQCEKATDHMSRAAALSGNSPELLVRLGEMHLEEGKLDKALEQAETVLAQDRQNPQAWALKGQVLRRRELVDDAHDCYQLALIHDPQNAQTRMALAEIYQLLGRPQRSLATLDQLADNQPTEQIPARAWMLKGQALSALGQSVDAKECLQHAALCAGDTDAQVLLELAQIQYASGDLAEARLCLGRALRNNPNNPHALNFQSVLDRSFEDYSRGSAVPVKTVGFQDVRKN